MENAEKPARRALALCAPLLALATATATAGPVVAAPADAAAERYVVVLHDGVTDVAGTAADHGRRYGAAVGHRYTAALKGYAAAVPADRVAALRADQRGGLPHS